MVDVVNLQNHVVTIAQAQPILREFMKLYKPVILWSSPGVGKTTVVNDIARDYVITHADGQIQKGIPLKYFHVALREPIDLRGLPYLDIEKRKVTWFYPDELPSLDDGEEGILFFDEFNTAPPSMQAATMSLILEGRIGDYLLPPKWHRIAAGNYLSDRACAQKMPTAIANRFKHIEIIPDLKAWTDYAITKGINDRIIAFLRVRPQLLHSMEGGDLKAWPSPRSWEEASLYVDYPDEMRMHLMSSAVGFAASNEFETFVKVYSDIPTFDEILKDPKSAIVPKNSSACYAVITMLAVRAEVGNIESIITYVERFEKEGMSDFMVLFCLDAFRHNADLLMVPVVEERLLLKVGHLIPDIQ